MNIRKIAFLLVALPLIFATQAYASGSNCTTMYGGGYTGVQSCAKITIDKKVQKPGTNDYVDSLSGNDPKYQPGQQVNFQITVQNVGTDKLTNIVVTDSLPQALTFVAGPGNYDTNANKLTFVIASLDSGQSQTVNVTTKVVDNITFPDNGYTCITNYVNAKENDLSADDSTLFCIERSLQVAPPVLGIKKTPSTGPVDAALPLLGAMASAGAYLTRKSRFMVAKKRGGVTK